jgi:hypothetical protein
MEIHPRHLIVLVAMVCAAAVAAGTATGMALAALASVLGAAAVGRS